MGKTFRYVDENGMEHELNYTEVNIDDSVTSGKKAWSSAKTKSELDKKATITQLNTKADGSTVAELLVSTTNHISNKNNPHEITKEQLGLGNVTNNAQVNAVTWDSTNKKITKTIGSTTSDVVTSATLKTAMALNNVDNTADAKKTVAKANTLATARQLKVALGSTTTVTFDGSTNQNSIPVSGTLAIGNGGTGATTIGGAQAALFASDAVTSGEPTDSDCLLSTSVGSEGVVDNTNRIYRRTFGAVKAYLSKTFMSKSGGSFSGQVNFDRQIVTSKGLYNYKTFSSSTSDSVILNAFYSEMVDNSCQICNAVKGGAGKSLIIWRTNENYGTALWMEYSSLNTWMYYLNNGSWSYRQVGYFVS